MINLGTRLRFIVSFTPRTLVLARKVAPFLIGTTLGELQNGNGGCGEDKTLFPLGPFGK
jgi:hypothetical protein